MTQPENPVTHDAAERPAKSKRHPKRKGKKAGKENLGQNLPDAAKPSPVGDKPGHENQGTRKKGRKKGGKASDGAEHNVFRDSLFRSRQSRASTHPFTHRYSTRGDTDESPAQMKEFLTSALSQVASSEASRQAVINYLATEDGLSRVRRIVETKFCNHYSVTTPMFDPHCLLFLRLITKRDVLQSLAVEKAVGTIYNVIYGLNGGRAVLFFQTIIGCLEGEDKNMSSRYESLLLITKALLHTLTVNQGAAIRAEFKSIAEILCAEVANYATAVEPEDDRFRCIYESLQTISDILSMGSTVTNSKPGKKKPSKPQQRTPIETLIDFPGDQSGFGPRHDNDHEMVEDIRILPTLSEVNSSRKDFLPTRDACSFHGHHQQGILRLLDSQFRLLREDTSGLLRDAVRMIVENWNTLTQEGNWGAKRLLIRRESPTPLRIYYGAQIRQFIGDAIQGFQFDVEFDQPLRVRKLGPERRRRHWINSRSLREKGGLLALVDAGNEDTINVAFLQVSKRLIEPIRGIQPGSVVDLVNNGERAMITLRPPSTPTGQDLASLLAMQTIQPNDPKRQLILVEFPVIQYNQFEGILRCLQIMHRNPADVPFTRWLTAGVRAPSIEFPSEITIIPPPSYLGIGAVDLSAILGPVEEIPGEEDIPLLLSTLDNPQTVQQQLCRRSSLDAGQAEALISALTHEVALIQGPPGTGKSYVGIQLAKCLVSNKERLALGPLLCVCYTNHALDQFLSELYKTGITRIVRIGSRSSSELMESISLDAYKRRGIAKLPYHGRKISDSKATLNALGAEIETVCKEIRGGYLAIAGGFMMRQAPEYGEMIREGNLDMLEGMRTWLGGNGPGDLEGNLERSIDELFSVGPWTLTKEERLRLFQYCHDLGSKDRVLRLQTLLQAHANIKKHHTQLFTQADTQVFDHMDVVGVTTTGLVNNSELLRTLKAKVLICEEAGEVLESHTLTALLPSIEHAILIGDHLQLRPKIARKALSLEYDGQSPRYNLDESLFERLANLEFPQPSSDNEAQTFKFPVAQLDYQRRMHPFISSLVRQTLYPKLKDHSGTTSYPEIAGIRRRLFWLDHDNYEDPGDPEDPLQSKTNTWEAGMVAALVMHLCRQGVYKRGEIAVLTPYVSQLRLLTEMLEKTVDLVVGDDDLADLDLENEFDREVPVQRNVHNGSLSDQVRMATVDNFQGEEAAVVIISLVRSNPSRNCGFLKTPNRINVLLSRAKHGMYIIGNAETSCRVPMWASVIKMLEEGLNIGTKLELCCTRHPSNKIHVSCPDDFPKSSPEGGCSEQCGLRLRCGHTCTFKCHPTKLHNATKCMEPCTSLRECGHVCQRKCHEDCGECLEVVPDVFLPCGHTAQVRCRDMGDLSAIKCSHIVRRKLPGCAHEAMAQCAKDITTIKCTQPCDTPLPCGHTCQNGCWSCRKSGSMNHGKCMAPCGRQYTTCSHDCKRPCHDGSQCPPCRLPCEVRCVHNKCPGKCSAPCPPCAERCGWECSHREHSCTLPCAVPCTIVPCNSRCEKILGCGHRCPGVCGEQCPEARFCQKCGDSSVLDEQVEFILLQRYADIDVDEDPILFLACGHFYTRSTLDGVMSLKEYYEIDPITEAIIRPRTSWRRTSTAPGCPFCRRSLRDIHRYNRVVKKALLDESTKRFVSKAQRSYIAVLKALDLHEEVSAVETGKFVEKWRVTNAHAQTGFDEFGAAIVAFEEKDQVMQRQVNNFIKNVSKTEQPFGRVNALLASAMARAEGSTGTTDSLSVEEGAIYTGFHVRGQCLDLRLAWVVLSTNERVYADATINADIRTVLSGKTRKQLPNLLEKCRTVRDRSTEEHFIAEQVQAMIYLALFSQLSLNSSPDTEQSLSKSEITQTLEDCEVLFESHSGTLAHLETDMEKAKRYCAGGTFHTTVTAEEKRQVYAAMASQFQGTGHWYYCQNNHPFTVGECGMPTEESRCPQCGEPVGGIDHRPLPGVRHAGDFEAEFANADGLFA
ncbi:P-loop containing nucleoside triphosphate hydrolase protein [Aspergillus unguis]